MIKAFVQDAGGRPLSPCSYEKGLNLVANGKAQVISQEPFTIRLDRDISRAQAKPEVKKQVQSGQSLLLHICCGPCSTFTSRHLAGLGWKVTGFWYNPNIEPIDEYTKRQQSLALYADTVGLPMVWSETESSEEFRALVAEHEQYPDRCALCYRLRLQKTAHEAARRGIGTISTSLLISPYQNLDQIREIGVQEAANFGIQFYYENMRRGYSERTRLTQEYGLYQQQYCGCSFSAQEAEQRRLASRLKPSLHVGG